MPYTHRKVGDKQCVYKKDGGAKVGCTKGSVEKYLAALHANANESKLPTTAVCPAELMGVNMNEAPKSYKSLIKRLLREGLES
jgi:hypothetical protein